MNLMTFHESQFNIYFALKNPIRWCIIELLTVNKSLIPSDLASQLNISLGRCCYHLDSLGGLVEKDNKNRYFLSKQGLRAVQLLHEPI